MNKNITKNKLIRLRRPLCHGEYIATDKFRQIRKHVEVCFPNGALVAITGEADDRESQLYAAMFADAPTMLLEIARLREALKKIRNLGINPNGDMKEMFKIANDALMPADDVKQT